MSDNETNEEDDHCEFEFPTNEDMKEAQRGNTCLLESMRGLFPSALSRAPALPFIVVFSLLFFLLFSCVYSSSRVFLHSSPSFSFLCSQYPPLPPSLPPFPYSEGTGQSPSPFTLSPHPSPPPSSHPPHPGPRPLPPAAATPTTPAKTRPRYSPPTGPPSLCLRPSQNYS